MLIFLDSNIICANFHMKGPSFEIMKKVGTIVLGQVVVDEVCNKYREKTKEQLKVVQKAVSELNNLLSVPIEMPSQNLLDTECEKYQDFLDFFCIETGMTVPEDYPRIPHREVVQRALLRKKPFKADGSTGYRDYLVWLTCLNTARMYSNEEIHFITNNIHDFSDSADKTKLHSDLLHDLSELDIPESRFHYWNSVKSFIDNCAGIRAAEIDEHSRLITEIEQNEDGFCAPLQKFVDEFIIGLDISRQDVLTLGEGATLKQVELFSDFSVEDMVTITDDEYLLDICADSMGIIDSYSNMSEIDELEKMNDEDVGFDLEILECDKNGKCRIRVTEGIQIHLRAIYSKKSKAIISIELDYIDDYDCPYCNY